LIGVLAGWVRGSKYGQRGTVGDDSARLLLEILASQRNQQAPMNSVATPQRNPPNDGFPSSDFDHDVPQVPLIEAVFQEIHDRDPQQQKRNLPLLAEKLANQGYLCIDEIKGLDADALASKVGLRPGDAGYIIRVVEKAMRRYKKGCHSRTSSSV